jgi:hypothetical protein
MIQDVSAHFRRGEIGVSSAGGPTGDDGECGKPTERDTAITADRNLR